MTTPIRGIVADPAFPIVSPELMARIAQARRDHFVSRVNNVMRLAGNPLGAEVRHFGAITAVMLRKKPRLLPNLTIGLGPGSESAVGAAQRWYQRHRQAWELEVVPVPEPSGLLQYLNARRFYQSSFATVLYGLTAHVRALLFSEMLVREVPPDEFARLMVEIDGTPEAERGFMLQLRAAEFAHDWRGYVAFVDGLPAARAALWMGAGVAVLGFAETRPEYRSRGCQTALIRQRIADAAHAGCDLVISQTAVGSTSQRNMERAGLRVAFTKVNWKQRNGR